MTTPHIPCLTAANRNPTLRHAVRRLKDLGLDSRRVYLTLTPERDPGEGASSPPPSGTWPEIYHQEPPPGTRLADTTALIVYVDPDCGPMAAVKQAWLRQSLLTDAPDPSRASAASADREATSFLSRQELSRRLWQLGELQNLLAHPPNLLAELVQQVPECLRAFCGMTPEMLAAFSPNQIATLMRLLPLKRNSHQPCILTRIFSRVLNLNCTFQEMATSSLPHLLLATLEARPEDLTPADQARIAILEHLFVPATCRVVVLYRHPIAVLDHPSARLNAMQAG